MAWIPYPGAIFPQSQNGQEQAGGLLPYTSAQLADPRAPQSVRDTMTAAQQAQAAATRYTPHTSALATALQAASGFAGGRLESKANAAAAPFQGQPQPDQPSNSLLGALLRGGSPSSTGPDDGSTPPASGWGAVGQAAGQAAQSIGRKSDRRLKSDIRRVGTLIRTNLPLYAYRLEGGPFEIGCMADEVALVRPDATWFDPDDGFARVAYERLV